MKKAIVTVFYNKNNNAGPKAQMDVIKFLKSLDYEDLTLPFNVRSKFGKFKYALYDLPHLFKNSNYDIVIFQYPIFSEFLVKQITKTIHKYTSAKLYFLTHDIDSLRASKKDEEFQKREIEQLNQTDGLIVHNRRMRKWLEEQGVVVPMVELGVFDYDNQEPLKKEFSYEGRVCFAGNLEKAPFLEKLTLKSAHLDIYGSNPAKNYKFGVEYKGQFSPDDLLGHLDQNFGLVWDGNSIETCNGRYGNYLRYNDPHKASLYLSMGIPIIIWKEAALAEFIVENNLGIAIDSLNNLDAVLEQVTVNDYKNLKLNALQMSEKLRNGKNIRDAVAKLERM